MYSVIMQASLSLVWILFLQGVDGFPSGGPYKSCANLYPKHSGTNAQSTAPPYNVTVNTTDYTGGEVIQVILQGLDEAQFKGFMVRANRVTGDTEDIVGEWIDLPDTANARYWYPREPEQTNCVTHNSPDLKSEVVLYWKAPEMELGDIKFYASFVQSFDTFWVFVPSPLITGPKDDSETFTGDISTDLTAIDFELCGDTKGCLLYPPRCGPNDCTLALTYTSHDNGVDFEAMAPQEGYLTFAISEDKQMGSDETVTCISTSEFDSVQHGFNPSYYNDRHRILGFSNLETARIDGRLQCKWTMPFVNSLIHLQESESPPVPHNHTFDLHQTWHVFLAYGHTYAGADVLGKHQVLPLISRGRVNFQENSIVTVDGLYLPMKAHAMLMMVGFMALMGISVVISRHYRNTFSRQIMGVQAWFQLHWGLNIIAAVIIAIGFIVIFSTLKKWSKAAYNHAVMGTITVALMLIQILAGFLRPGLTSSRRQAFNWIHRISGKLIQLFSAVTILLSLSVSYLSPALCTALTPLFAAWIIIQLFWELIVLEVYKWTHQQKGEQKKSDGQEMTALRDGQSPEGNAPSDLFLKIEFVLYCVVMCVITLTGIVIVFIY